MFEIQSKKDFYKFKLCSFKELNNLKLGILENLKTEENFSVRKGLFEVLKEINKIIS